MRVSGGNDEDVDIYVQNDGASSCHIVEVGATQTDQPAWDETPVHT